MNQGNTGNTITPAPLSLRLLITALLLMYYLVFPLQHPLRGVEAAQVADAVQAMRVCYHELLLFLTEGSLVNMPSMAVPCGEPVQTLTRQMLLAMRAASVLSLFFSALLIHRLAFRIWCERYTARVAFLIFLTTLMIYAEGSYAFLTSVITLAFTLCIWGGWVVARAEGITRRVGGLLLILLSCALGWLLAGERFPCSVLLAALLWSWRERYFRTTGILMVLLVMVLYSSVTGASVALRAGFQPLPDAVAGPGCVTWMVAGFTVLLSGMLPWAALVPGACCRAWLEHGGRGAEGFLLCCILSPVLSLCLVPGELLMAVVPCCVPLALLLSRYVVHLLNHAPHVLRLNGWFNFVGGITCSVGAALLFLPPVSVSKTMHNIDNVASVMLIVTALLGWGMTGAIALLPSARGWLVTAFCPLPLLLITGYVLPDGIPRLIAAPAHIFPIGVSNRATPGGNGIMLVQKGSERCQAERRSVR